MTEDELRAVKPFDKLPFVAESNEAECEKLERPNEPWKFDGSIAEASDADELATYLADQNYAPKGAIIYNEGVVRAYFWRLRKDK